MLAPSRTRLVAQLRTYLTPLHASHSSLVGRRHRSPGLARIRNLSLTCCRATSSDGDKGQERLYARVEGSENLERYTVGGYHPVQLGDELSGGRYQIVHKLGYGSYSTVWLARDQQANRYVALKILMSVASGASSESAILARLRSGNPTHPGHPYVQTLLDDFTLEGPNGQHKCLVTEAAGGSLALSKDASSTWLFPCDVARAIAAQLTMGLAYVHSCGVAHGDLHPNNILIQIPDLDFLTVEQVYERFGEPEKELNRRLDGRVLGPEIPSYSILPAFMEIPAEKVQVAQVKIADFGVAFPLESPPPTLSTPILLLPPEHFFHASLGSPVDIWTLACTLYEILGERMLFEAFIPNADNTLAEMVSTLGVLPLPWWDQWRNRSKYFEEDGSWTPDFRGIMSPVSRPLKQRLWDMGRSTTPETCQFSPEEMTSLENLLLGMMRYEPSERMTANEVMNSEYIRRWCIPAMTRPSTQGLRLLTAANCQDDLQHGQEGHSTS